MFLESCLHFGQSLAQIRKFCHPENIAAVHISKDSQEFALVAVIIIIFV